MNQLPQSNTFRTSNGMEMLKDSIIVKKLDSIAEDPIQNEDSTTYSLTIVKRDGSRLEDDVHHLNKFCLGLALTAPKGFHICIRASQELLRAGYMLPNTFIPKNGVEIKIDLLKFTEDQNIELPARVLEFTLEKTYLSHFCYPKSSTKERIRVYDDDEEEIAYVKVPEKKDSSRSNSTPKQRSGKPIF